MKEGSMDERRDERGPMDPTRKLLKVFGVKVTDYEAKTAAILERYAAAATDEERATLIKEAVELTADLSHWLREVQGHVLAKQEEVLGKLADR
jgi:hypothetical protein